MGIPDPNTGRRRRRKPRRCRRCPPTHRRSPLERSWRSRRSGAPPSPSMTWRVSRSSFGTSRIAGLSFSISGGRPACPACGRFPTSLPSSRAMATMSRWQASPATTCPGPSRKQAVEGIQDGLPCCRSPRPINYRLYLEGDKQEAAGPSRQFNVQVYPTLVLLDHSGNILFRGTDTSACSKTQSSTIFSDVRRQQTDAPRRG